MGTYIQSEEDRGMMMMMSTKSNKQEGGRLTDDQKYGTGTSDEEELMEDQDPYATSLAQQQIFGLSLSVVVPAALTTIIQLDVPDILAAAGKGCALSAEEILMRMPNRSDASNSKNLERLLRVLAFKGLFKEESVKGEKRFSLAPMSRALVKNQVGGTMANYSLLTSMGKEFTTSCQNMSAAVLRSEVPFAVAHDGKHQFEYCESNSSYNQLFQAAMSDHSNQLVRLMLAKYSEGFKQVKRLVDVGGGVGTTVAKIVKHYPHIQGLNFDLPHVVAHAPQYPGVEHVAGDMFKSIPTGCDACFLKNIFHDWDDSRCIKILQNCFRALPSSGKVIMVDAVLPTKPPLHESLDDLCAFEADITMMAVSTYGRERDEMEWRQLAAGTGFVDIKLVKLDYMYVIEAIKP